MVQHDMVGAGAGSAGELPGACDHQQEDPRPARPQAAGGQEEEDRGRQEEVGLLRIFQRFECPGHHFNIVCLSLEFIVTLLLVFFPDWSHWMNV